MMNKQKKGSSVAVPLMVVKRCTKYMTLVNELQDQGSEWVSSGELADALGLTSSTVRQDLSYIDFYGVSKKGYEISGLRKVLASILGADLRWKAVVVGAGNIGKALSMHEDFIRKGIDIIGLFDSSAARVGKKTGSLVIADVMELQSFASRHKVDIGIIAVPASAAQQVADLMVRAGIRGILNLAVTHLTLPNHVHVVDFRVINSLFELTYLIKAK